MKRMLVILALGGAAYTGHRLIADDGPAAGPATASLALDRIWIDHIPRGERDTVEVFVAISSESIGIFQQAAQWRGAHELFKFEAHGDQLRLVYPHTGDKDKVTARRVRAHLRLQQVARDRLQRRPARRSSCSICSR